jgi:Ca2+-binding RTX toxin-like protein
MKKIYGTIFDDKIKGTNGDDWIFGKAGDDRIFGQGGSDRIEGGSGNDTLNGQAGDDFIYGDAGRDDLAGGEGNDRLYGGGGFDVLHGGQGNDLLTGGSGYDDFHFEVEPWNKPGKDRIVDFSQSEGDWIFLGTSIDFYDLDTNGDNKLTNADAYVNWNGGAETKIDVGAAFGTAWGKQVLSVHNEDGSALTISDFGWS